MSYGAGFFDCAYVAVDVNGSKSPNQQGMDLFHFIITNDSIIPYGTPIDTSNYNFASSCADKTTGAGYGCAGWVILNENMDYLKCSGLAYGGKTSCN